MGTEFLRLKRKHTAWRLLRALMAGLSSLLLVTGALLVCFKLTGTDPRAAIAIGAGALAGILVAVIRWLAMRRSDMRSAEQIDSEHHLRERVQTMIAFRNEDSAMLQMQREDTENKLKAVKSFGVKAGSVAVHILALVLSAVIFVTGAVLPARAETIEPEVTEPNYDATAWQIASLEELIRHVEESNMAAIAKEATVAELRSLLETLQGDITVSAFKEKVVTVIANTYSHTDRVNSNDDLHDVIFSIDHPQAENLAYVAGTLDNLEFSADVEDIGYQLGLETNLPETAALAEGLDAQLARVVSDYMTENDYDETDRLYQAMLALAAGLHEVAEQIDAGAEAEQISNRLGEVIHSMKSAASIALEQQTVTKQECVHVVETLCSVFGISASECPRDPDPTYSKKADDDYTENSGGAGTGDMQYAGDEQVYDYKQDQYVSYTELIGEYYAAMLQASLEGRLSEEMVEYILKYFSQLYTG